MNTSSAGSLGRNTTEESAKRSLAVFSKWSPSHPEHFHAFLGRADGNGRFAVVETDDVAESTGTQRRSRHR